MSERVRNFIAGAWDDAEDGKLFTSRNPADSGKVIWKHVYPCEAKDPNGFPGPRCTPTVDGDLVYCLSRHGDLFCLEAKTGKVKWSKNLVKDLGGSEPMHGDNRSNQGWGYSGSPLIEKGWMLIEAGGNGLFQDADDAIGPVDFDLLHAGIDLGHILIAFCLEACPEGLVVDRNGRFRRHLDRRGPAGYVDLGRSRAGDARGHHASRHPTRSM